MIVNGRVAVGLASILAMVPGSATGQSPAQKSGITAAELTARLRFFSSDLFEGRQPGTRGESLTTSYLISELESFGVQPGAGQSGWLQAVSILTHQPQPAAPVEAGLTGRVTRALEHGREIRVSNHAAAGTVAVDGELVFVGYGIDAPLYRWNDFAGLDLRGKIAVALLGEPNLPDDSIAFNGFRASRYSWARDKIDEMDRRGAVGVLWVVGSGPLARGPVTGARRLAERANRSGVRFTGNLTDSAAASLLRPAQGSWGELKAAAGRPGFRPVPLDLSLSVRFQTVPHTVRTSNVVGVIPGTDRARRDEHIVLSAHWDAYGIGTPVRGDSIYNGALDDGSGVTALLALARVFAAQPEPRSLTFLFTTAEEWGLLGAEAFVCSGLLPPDRIVANLNIDDGTELFGPKRDVAPLGIELSTLGSVVAKVAAGRGLRVAPDPFPQEGFFLRADNYPFAKAGIPALYLALGTDAVDQPTGWTDAKVKDYLERHYHRPSDDFETVVLDIEGSRQLADFTHELTTSLARAPGRPEWLPSSEFRRRVGGASSAGC